MPWSSQLWMRIDWCKNIRAGGGCAVRWKGRDYAMTQPEVLDAAAVSSAFGGLQVYAMRRLNTRQCLLLPPRELVVLSRHAS
jgi:hypothetical protein